MEKICALCGREAQTTFHHLIPKSMHGKKRLQKLYSAEEMHSRGLDLCSLCHHAIHDLIPSEKELAEKYNTRELLMEHEAIRKHVEWASKQSRQK
jgi:hypothetical protein